MSLLDIIEAVEGPTDDGRCVMATQPCPAPEPCAVHDTWLRARSALTDELASTSLLSITTKHANTFDGGDPIVAAAGESVEFEAS